MGEETGEGMKRDTTQDTTKKTLESSEESFRRG